MPKNKIYAVKNGHKTGIFYTWDDCKDATVRFKGAIYKSFPSLDEAMDYLSNIEAEKAKPLKDELIAYVDGSFELKTQRFSYGVVLISESYEKTLSGIGDNEEIGKMRNVAGELRGAMEAMRYAKTNHYKKLTIYHDYEGIAKWALNKWKTNLEGTKKYQEYFNKISEFVEISFVKVSAHTGHKYNEMADQLAKEAFNR